MTEAPLQLLSHPSPHLRGQIDDDRPDIEGSSGDAASKDYSGFRRCDRSAGDAWRPPGTGVNGTRRGRIDALTPQPSATRRQHAPRGDHRQNFGEKAFTARRLVYLFAICSACSGSTLGIVGGFARMTAIGAKPSSSKPDADRRSTQLDPLDFAFGESRLRVISGGAGPSPTRQVKLNKRTLTRRTARLSFVQKSENFCNENGPIEIIGFFCCII